MSLLSTHEVKQKIIDEVSRAADNLQIISAFCKLPAIKFIDENISRPIKQKKLMVRFLLSDILHGATDFELFDYCKANGWQMYVRFDLHAKTYIFDRKRCILGSANLTSKGLGLSLHGNYELSSFAEVDDSDLKKIDTLFDNAILMTDELYIAMKSDYEIAQSNQTPSKTFKWNTGIEQKFNPKIDLLFTYDFPSTSSPNFNDVNSFEFLEMGYIPSQEELKQAFRWSKAFMWLYNYVSSCPEKTSYFGGVTAALHNTLVNDPKPYRKEVKDLLANTLGWIQALDIQEITIDIPNYSQRIRLKETI
jgi:hypothetical protein